jgi:hypothetical protein
VIVIVEPVVSCVVTCEDAHDTARAPSPPTASTIQVLPPVSATLAILLFAEHIENNMIVEPAAIVPVGANAVVVVCDVLFAAYRWVGAVTAIA